MNLVEILISKVGERDKRIQELQSHQKQQSSAKSDASLKIKED